MTNITKASSIKLPKCSSYSHVRQEVLLCNKETFQDVKISIQYVVDKERT